MVLDGMTTSKWTRRALGKLFAKGWRIIELELPFDRLFRCGIQGDEDQITHHPPSCVDARSRHPLPLEPGEWPCHPTD